jgi:uncharacterized protein YbjT (DUF2867 family)
MQDQVAAAAVAVERVALVAGATGLVGQAVLAGLLTDKRYKAVHCVGRRPLGISHPKVISHVVDFNHLMSIPGLDQVDDVFITLGTTIKAAGSQKAFKAVDFEAIVAVAVVSKRLGATKLGVVSAMGADAASKVFYNRIKGEMEEALGRLGYSALVIARPSLLTGDRSALAQAARPAEKLGILAMSFFKPLIPANYQAIGAGKVASALLRAVRDQQHGTRVILSGEMQSTG